ncbi:hypothetical protein HYH03_015698 [Edaphochlamys debaryana]|uniref:Uncharacterized protein n=1 Tax=Edaphochlamys debaryana TaxID=47281 RepID=A0A835XLL4_9CHLO|nr:hypothetical protein HYH03_015698 [Edaphochlamys debaryana]|eukprot:KAG2485527.1 hypothetical protein HYH03_015698 [Edaphochlamys debaryana]
MSARPLQLPVGLSIQPGKWTDCAATKNKLLLGPNNTLMIQKCLKLKLSVEDMTWVPVNVKPLSNTSYVVLYEALLNLTRPVGNILVRKPEAWLQGLRGLALADIVNTSIVVSGGQRRALVEGDEFPPSVICPEGAVLIAEMPLLTIRMRRRVDISTGPELVPIPDVFMGLELVPIPASAAGTPTVQGVAEPDGTYGFKVEVTLEGTSLDRLPPSDTTPFAIFGTSTNPVVTTLLDMSGFSPNCTLTVEKTARGVIYESGQYGMTSPQGAAQVIARLKLRFPYCFKPTP